MPNHAKQSRNPLARLSRKQQIFALGGVIAVLGIAVGLAVTSGGTPASNNTTTTTGNNNSSSTTLPALASNICPLTGLPAAGGQDPRRPALLVKVGNEPYTEARPQGGLNEADIVFDTPAEGFIMRYMAVYQCNNASAIGPTRSVRWVDYHLARMFVTPILAFAGGINPNVDTVFKDKWISPADLLTNAGAAGTRISSRQAPDNLFTSTSALYSMYKKEVTPPPPVFQYSPNLPSTAATTVGAQIDFSSGTYGTWKWNPAGNDWIHGYANSGTDVDTDTNQPVTTTNIVVMIVAFKIGPYIESTGGSGDIQSETVGQGAGYVLRNGKRVAVTWHRKDLVNGLTFTDTKGNTVDLAPGRTWVEIVPNTVANIKGSISFSA